jgi:hypothetical protein
LVIVETLGFVVVPALAPEAPNVRPIDPAKSIANKSLRRVLRAFMKVLLSAPAPGRRYLQPYTPLDAELPAKASWTQRATNISGRIGQVW